MKNPESPSLRSQEVVDELDFRYVRSPCYRVVHCDGALGAITLRGDFHMTVYSERQAPPLRSTRRIDRDQGTVGAEVLDTAVGRVERELEVDLMMSIQTAKELYAWLGNRLGPHLTD